MAPPPLQKTKSLLLVPRIYPKVLLDPVEGNSKFLELDEAVLRRFPKRIHIPLPTDEDRQRLLAMLLKNQKHTISDKDLRLISAHLEGYSSSDITQLAKDAAMAPLRELSAAQVQK